MIGTDIATLVLEVDATRVDKATESLTRLVEAGKAAEGSETKRAKASKTATEALHEQTASTESLIRAQKSLATMDQKGLDTSRLRALSEQDLVEAMERRHKVMLRSAEMTGALALREAAAAEKVRQLEERRIQTARTLAAVNRLVQETGLRASETALAGLLREEEALARKTRTFKQAIAEQKAAEADKAAYAASPAGIFAAAGVKSPEEVARGLRAIRDAEDELARMRLEGKYTAQELGVVEDNLHKRRNLYVEGNVRHRNALRQTAAAMASLAFEAAGAAFLVTSLAGALAAPALVGVRLQMKLEDVNLAMASILSSMGRINERGLKLPEALEAAKRVTKELLADSVRYGVNIAALADTMRSITAPGLAAGMNLKQIQEIATVGTIAVKTIGLDAKQSVQEIRDLVAGGIQAASSTLANTIGVKDSDVAAWRKAGIVYDELMQRLKGYLTTAELSTKTMSGAIENLKTKFAILMMDENGFKGLTQAIIDLGDYIGRIDPITQKFELNPRLVEDVKVYWGVLKGVGATLYGILQILGMMEPLVSAVARGLNSLSDAKKLGSDQVMVEATARLNEELRKGQKAFSEYSVEGAKANLMLAEFSKMTRGEESGGLRTPALGSPISYRSEGFEASITGGVEVALAAESKFWDQFIGVTRAGLELSHAITMERFESGAKILAAARRQEFTGTEAQTKAHYEALAAEEKKYNLARDGEIKKYKRAKEALEKEEAKPDAYKALILDLEALAAQSGRAATEVEKLHAKWKADPELQKKGVQYLALAEALAESTDQHRIALAYAEQVQQVSSREDASLQERLDAQIKHNQALGQAKEVTNELRAAQEARLAVSLLQQAADIEAANTGGSEINAANRERARSLRKEARQMAELSKQHTITAQKEAAIASEKSWLQSVNKIEGAFHDAWLSIGEKGISMWETLTRSFKKMFRTTVLEYIYKELAKPFVLNVIASVAGVIGATGMAQAAETAGATMAQNVGASAAGSWLGSASTTLGEFSAGAQAGIYGGVEAAQGIAAGTGATSAASIGSYVGAALPVVTAVVASYYLSKEINKGKTIDFGKVDNLFPGLSTLVNKFSILPAAFGRGPKESQAPRLRGEFSAEGFSGSIQSDWRKKGGWFRSDKSGTDILELTEEQQSAADALVLGSKAVFDSLLAVSGEATRSLGDWTFAVDHEVTTQEQQTKMFNDLADSMGTTLIPEIEKFRKEGENLADTALRLRDTFVLTDKLALLLGKDTVTAFGDIGLASAGARAYLAELAGGLSQLSSLTQGYYDNFFTDAEKLANDTQTVGIAFAQLGMAVPQTKEDFKSLVEAQDLTTDAGQRMFLSLLALAPALASVIERTDAVAQEHAEESTSLLKKRASLEIDLLLATGDATGALAAQRQIELEALDASLRPLQEQVYAQQDLNTAYDKASASLREMKLLTTDAFASAFDYAKYLRKAKFAGIPGAGEALGSPETTFVPGKTDTSGADFIKAVDKLRQELQAGQIAQAQFLAETAKILQRWNGDGMPQTRTY